MPFTPTSYTFFFLTHTHINFYTFYYCVFACLEKYLCHIADFSWYLLTTKNNNNNEQTKKKKQHIQLHTVANNTINNNNLILLVSGKLYIIYISIYGQIAFILRAIHIQKWIIIILNWILLLTNRLLWKYIFVFENEENGYRWYLWIFNGMTCFDVIRINDRE